MTQKILVVGDSMEDLRIDCSVSRLCPEGPLPIYDVDNETVYAGGAANVALNAMRMGGDVALLTPLAMGASSLKSTLLETDIVLHPVSVRANTVKTRIFTDRVMRARIDKDYILTLEEAEVVLDFFRELVGSYNIIVFSDYGKFALHYVDQMIEYCSGRCVLVDPKGDEWSRYEGATVIKANSAECAAMGQTLESLTKSLNSHVVRTMGSGGSTIHYRNGARAHVRPHRVNAVDPTGAGDSYLAAMAVALAENMDIESACRRGSVAGALATTHVGTAVITAEEIDACMTTHLTSTSM